MTTSLGLDQLDLLVRSPDGEPRGLLARAGDLFPLDPREHLRSGGINERASDVRPWGLGMLRVPQPQAGKHEGTGEFTSEKGDGARPEEMGKD